jgi:hypothetical protein
MGVDNSIVSRIQFFALQKRRFNRRKIKKTECVILLAHYLYIIDNSNLHL